MGYWHHLSTTSQLDLAFLALNLDVFVTIYLNISATKYLTHRIDDYVLKIAISATVCMSMNLIFMLVPICTAFEKFVR
jgi:hypothetical protein